MAQEERRVCMTTEDGTQVWIPESKVEAWKQADHNAPLTPEEKVRQWFIGVLKERMKVPEYMMMSEVAMKFGGKDFRADILVYGRDTAPLMVVECKREDVPMSREVLEQALRYNLVLNVKYVVITNGLKTFGFVRDGETYSQMKQFPDWETMQK